MSETGSGYVRWFSPSAPASESEPANSYATGGDYQRDDLYDCDDQTVLAINVAMATQRPLLVSGPSGCGKTSLARYIGYAMKWPVLRHTITSRTTARDLLYSFDQLRRLHDAQAKDHLDSTSKRYITPGVLWKAFDPAGAENLTPSTNDAAPKFQAPQVGKGAVVLLDEIDKADPDVPNNLLEPMGSYRFFVTELEFWVSTNRPPLVVLTTNNERRLPDAFLRRCVDLVLPWPTRDRLKKIGELHFGQKVDSNTLESVLNLLCPNDQTPEQAAVSTAEYLDTLRACSALTIQEQSWAWQQLPNVTVKKSGRLERDFR
jgi:MoxR-like ATPase